jgi:hypothetical protein
LKSGNAHAMAMCDLATIPPVDRPSLLHRMLSKTQDQPGVILEAARQAWPWAEESASTRLTRFGEALASWSGLSQHRPSPAQWLDRLRWVIDRIAPCPDLNQSQLAAEVVGATGRSRIDPSDLWRLRQWLFGQDSAWKTLAADLRWSLASLPASRATELVEEWDQRIDKGVKSGRFWEVVLNACDGERLAVVASVRADELRTLDRIPWWDGVAGGEAIPEMREAFARLIPMAPLSEDRLGSVQNWLRNPRTKPSRDDVIRVESAQTVAVDRLSPSGDARWRCVEALSKLYRKGIDASTRGWDVLNWKNSNLPLSRLSLEDRVSFVAWMIRSFDSVSDFQVAPVAKWLFDSGFVEVGSLSRWQELTGPTDSSTLDLEPRSELAGLLRRELLILQREAQERADASRHGAV